MNPAASFRGSGSLRNHGCARGLSPVWLPEAARSDRWEPGLPGGRAQTPTHPLQMQEVAGPSPWPLSGGHSAWPLPSPGTVGAVASSWCQARGNRWSHSGGTDLVLGSCSSGRILWGSGPRPRTSHKNLCRGPERVPGKEESFVPEFGHALGLHAGGHGCWQSWMQERCLNVLA